MSLGDDTGEFLIFKLHKRIMKCQQTAMLNAIKNSEETNILGENYFDTRGFCKIYRCRD